MLKFAANTIAGITLATLSITAHATPVQMQDTDIREFVRWYVEQTDTPLAIHPKATGTLTVYAPDVADHQLDEFFQGVLNSHGYTILPGNPPTVAPSSQASTAQRADGPTDPRDVIASPPTLEKPPEPQATHLFPFDNVRADDIAPLITSFLTQQSGDATQPHVQVLHASNAVLAKGPEKQLAQLQDLIPDIDVSHPQILIQAVIFETTDGDTFDLGVSLGKATGGDVAGGFNTDNLGTSLSGTGGTFGIFDGNVLAFAINALQRDSTSKVLSTPQILTLSGKRGIISIGQNVPFVTGRVTGESADIDNPFQTIERRDVGIRLNVLPVVTASGLVIMDITTSADSLTDSLVASDIITNQRQINTTVQIRSGQTLLLGGLSSQDDRSQVSGVPGLSEIPLAGRLFKNESTSAQRTNLHVLLQATVLPRFDANQRVTDQNATQSVAGLVATRWYQEVETRPVTRLAE
ncbi:secretin N-terminal domain-containing protein [Vreelandella gomseomensis]|uniref:Secretin N-terminal domain-containing protein n=1 Tax=Vreelandella gomseomensis TaxID=370766 RepID=A0ABU1GDD9_9GAMM|nr:secretin N-terminal domain-containing protein [Halomonas gomseomensis]MDR5875508.1 secretin N-terminal domain-containing protein [Halomonas gomseomensis]